MNSMTSGKALFKEFQVLQKSFPRTFDNILKTRTAKYLIYFLYFIHLFQQLNGCITFKMDTDHSKEKIALDKKGTYANLCQNKERGLRQLNHYQ